MAPAPQTMGGEMPDFRFVSLVPPPTGVSNFHDPETRAPMAIVVSSVMLALATCATLTRFYARHFILGPVSIDDWMGLVGMLFTAEYSIYAIVLFTLPGMGPHMWDIPGIVFFDSQFGLRLLFTEIMYCPSAYFVKLSIFLLYRRIFVAPGGRAKSFIMGGLYLSTILYLALTILSFAFCTKSASLVDGGDCHTKGSYVGWALAAVNLVTDLYLLAIPPFIVVRLHISSHRKWAVAAVFLFSGGATIASTISVYYRVYVSKHSTDFSWNIVPAAVATVCELNLGVICSCLPAINVLFHKQRMQRRSNYATFGGSSTHTKNGYLSRLSNKFRTFTSGTGQSHTSESQNDINSTERDIVKLIDISQYSVPAGRDRSPTA
ncbi:hypothetical protein CC80DRAFT_598406 [Byssothecium circinans]|uniref:Rhodopsin domain-containing protein n=1 Tax=Byssothecium circinans TaxID=147558 RepID=A0A6A5TEK7_9PLEO|nr:hypothetical protein CC80DRAFT_598406 [Byssothecium circinans]